MPGFSGQGKVFVGTRNPDGTPGLLRWLGNVSTFKLTQQEDTVERNESYSGSRSPNRRLTKATKCESQIIFDEFTNDNLALALLGSITTVAAGSAVTDWLAPTGAIVGSVIALPDKNVSAVVVTDSTGTPKPLVAGTNYSLDAVAGTIEILDITTGGAFLQPLKIDYTPGAVKVVGAFKTVSQEVYLRFNGINTDDGSRCIVDVFRNRLSPTKERNFISDDYQDFELTGTVLRDATRLSSSAGGQYYSETYL